MSHPSRKVVPLTERLRELKGTERPGWLGAKAGATPRVAFAPPQSTAGRIEDAPEFKRRLDEARAEAEIEGLRAAQHKVEALVERYGDALVRLQEMTRENARPLAAEVVELALVVAREILGRECSIDHEPLLARVEAALRSVAGDATIEVRLSKGDLTYIAKRRPDLAEAGVVLIEDPRLGPGGCVVETPERIVDASIEARLDAVRAALNEVVEAGGDDEPAEAETPPPATEEEAP